MLLKKLDQSALDDIGKQGYVDANKIARKAVLEDTDTESVSLLQNTDSSMKQQMRTKMKQKHCKEERNKRLRGKVEHYKDAPRSHGQRVLDRQVL